MNNINRIKINITGFFFVAFALLFVSCDFSHELPEANSIEDETLPNAFFTYVQGDIWYRLNFANGSTSASSYLWDFGDGREILTELPEVSIDGLVKEGIIDYPIIEDEAITYTVTLTATDDNGASSIYSEDVIIEFDADNNGAYDTYTAEYTIINTYDESDPVSVADFSSEQTSKDNFAINAIDDDISTLWTAQDTENDGEFTIYNLGSAYDLSLIRLSFLTKTGEVYGYQIFTSTTGEEADFDLLLPTTGESDFMYLAGSVDLTDLDIDVNAQYIKLVVYGRFNETDTSVDTSEWTNLQSIKFYTDVVVVE